MVSETKICLQSFCSAKGIASAGLGSPLILFPVTGSLVLSLLQVLSQVVNVRLQVFMNCRDKLSEMPLKR